MDFQEIILEELASLDRQHQHTALDIIETGTIRSSEERYRTGDGWSTLAIAKYVQEHGGTATSVDLDVSTAREVLANHPGQLDQYVNLIEGHSIQVLTRLAMSGRKFDVALLDSDNDSQLILDEYLVVSAMLRRPGVLMVDDVDLDSSLVVKGHKLVPWLESEGVPYEITQREADGYTIGVLIARLGVS